MNSQFNSVSDLMNRFFKSRLSRNTRYSLRAFARDCGLSPGFISQVLSGKKTLSPEHASQVSKKLKLSSNLENILILLTHLESGSLSKSPQEVRDYLKICFRQRTMNPFENHTAFDQELFEKVNSFNHILIMEFLPLLSPSQDPLVMIPENLGIPKLQALEVIEELIRHRLIEKTSLGFQKINLKMALKPQMSKKSVRQFHIDNMKNSIRILENKVNTQDFENREVLSMVVSSNPEKLELARKRIQEFTGELLEILTDGDSSEIYTFSMQLMPMIKEQKKIKKEAV